MPQNNEIVKWENLKDFAAASKEYANSKIAASESGVTQQLNAVSARVDTLTSLDDEIKISDINKNFLNEVVL